MREGLVGRTRATTSLLLEGAHARFGFGLKSWLADIVFGGHDPKSPNPTALDR
jgi:hypothetical protein